MKSIVKKGQKVVCPILGDEIATVQYVCGDKVDIKYLRSKYVVSVTVSDLKPAGI
jgi:hypothetical protein